MALIVFLYVFWKRLKDDYIANQIFSVAFLSIAGFISAVIYLKLFSFNWSFWGITVGVIFGMLVGVYRFKIKLLDALNSEIVAWSPLIIGAGVFTGITLADNLMIILSLIFGILYLSNDLILKLVQDVTKFKYGRSHISGLIVISLYMVLRFILAIYHNKVLFFLDYDAVISVLVFVISTATVVTFIVKK